MTQIYYLQGNQQSGLAYNRFRYYDLETGNYLSRDTIELQSGFTNNKSPREIKYITPDVDRHNDGFRKGAKSVKDLGSRKTRSGTYDINLKRIGN